MGMRGAVSLISPPPLPPPHINRAFRTPASLHLRLPLLFSTAVENLSSAPLLLLDARRLVRVFSVSSSSRRKRGSDGAAAAAASGSDDDDDDDSDALEEGEGVADPLLEMSRWHENKPSGFGEGKSYDTTIEEKLLEEIEQSRKAQLLNVGRLKSNTPKPNIQGQLMKETHVPSGIHVRVSNLPRKKNIHRDLQLAFKGFSGIVKISPAVIGNQKTRDPICKGFAYLELNSKEVAERFVDQYSKQTLLFGRVQKQITCDIMITHRSSDAPEQGTESLANLAMVRETNKVPRLPLTDPDALLVQPVMEAGIETTMASEQLTSTSTSTLLNDAKSGVADGRVQSKQQRPRKKIVRTTKTLKTPKQVLSARLKVKERNVLTGAISKYGGTAASVLSRES